MADFSTRHCLRSSDHEAVLGHRSCARSESSDVSAWARQWLLLGCSQVSECLGISCESQEPQLVKFMQKSTLQGEERHLSLRPCLETVPLRCLSSHEMVECDIHLVELSRTRQLLAERGVVRIVVTIQPKFLTNITFPLGPYIPRRSP